MLQNQYEELSGCLRPQSLGPVTGSREDHSAVSELCRQTCVAALCGQHEWGDSSLFASWPMTAVALRTSGPGTEGCCTSCMPYLGSSATPAPTSLVRQAGSRLPVCFSAFVLPEQQKLQQQPRKREETREINRQNQPVPQGTSPGWEGICPTWTALWKTRAAKDGHCQESRNRSGKHTVCRLD